MIRIVATFPLAFWRGEIGFLPSALLVLLGLRVGITLLGGIPYLTIDVLLLVWQITGTWRAMANAQADRPDLVTHIIGYAVIFISLLIVAQSHLDRTSRAALERLPEAAASPTGLRLVPTLAVLDGPISFTMASALEDALIKNPQISRLHLSSEGGRVFAARAIVVLVEAYKLDTHVDGTCASACALIFVAGQNRTLGAKARLGFHGYRQDSYLESVNPEEEEAKDTAAFRLRGISEGFLAQVFTTPPDQMWFPDRGALFQAGVTTAP